MKPTIPPKVSSAPASISQRLSGRSYSLVRAKKYVRLATVVIEQPVVTDVAHFDFKRAINALLLGDQAARALIPQQPAVGFEEVGWLARPQNPRRLVVELRIREHQSPQARDPQRQPECQCNSRGEQPRLDAVDPRGDLCIEVIRHFRHLAQIAIDLLFIHAIEEGGDIESERLEDGLEDVCRRHRLVVLELGKVRLLDANHLRQLRLGEITFGPQLLHSFAKIHERLPGAHGRRFD